MDNITYEPNICDICHESYPPCIVIICLDGCQHNYCKPCLLKLAEGIKDES